MKSVRFSVWERNKVLNNGAHEGIMDNNKTVGGGGEFTEEGGDRAAEMGGSFT
ncbi:hypothetical protein HanIR_Chr13g0623441 [Helianthus annuus]|nr:hypothetical protein HanIR_Chr13g0623441 [Helianthus annuus]